MLGRAKGAAIKLDSDEEVTMSLHVGEGIETTLTGRQAGFCPVWALGSADAIASFPVLVGLEALTIFAEREDDGGRNAANARAIERCGQRYLAAGIDIIVIDPSRGDLNDLVDRRAS
jgi:putative DNA primase/helicase